MLFSAKMLTPASNQSGFSFNLSQKPWVVALGPFLGIGGWVFGGFGGLLFCVGFWASLIWFSVMNYYNYKYNLWLSLT
jgi:hypothetical protein